MWSVRGPPLPKDEEQKRLVKAIQDAVAGLGYEVAAGQILVVDQYDGQRSLTILFSQDSK